MNMRRKGTLRIITRGYCGGGIVRRNENGEVYSVRDFRSETAATGDTKNETIKGQS